MANLDSLINQLHMSYDCERKPEYQRKAYTARENTQKDQNHPGGLNREPKQQHSGLLPLKTKTILCTGSTHPFSAMMLGI